MRFHFLSRVHGVVELDADLLDLVLLTGGDCRLQRFFSILFSLTIISRATMRVSGLSLKSSRSSIQN